jgi:thymidylate synthase
VVSAKVDETIKIASEPWFERFAETRINYMEDVFQPQLIDICEILDNDPGSRRAYIPNFDWYWEGHDPCNMLYHFLLRDNVLSLTVVLRSSDVYKVLPLDLKAACYFLKFINSELNSAYALERPVTIGDIRFLVSSLHIYSDDKLAFEKEIRNEH